MLPTSLTSFSFTIPAQPQSLASGGTDSVQTQTGTKEDRLLRLPDSILHLKSEWLKEQEMLNLMQTSRRHHWLGNKYYEDRLKKNRLRTAHPALDYRDPGKRIEHNLLTNQTGRNYLAKLGIQFPLTSDIQSGKMTVAQAQQFLQAQQKIMQATLDNGVLLGRQKEYFSNPLLAEHFLCGRCDRATLIRLADKGRHLFYSMTLQSLFRSGALIPTDLEGMSAAGVQLLHDPLLVGLFQNGAIKKRDVLHLTQTQFEALLICRPLVANRTLSVQCLQHEQLTAIRKAGLLDDLHDKRITLSDALAGRAAEPTVPAEEVFRTGSGSSLNQSDLRRLLTKTPLNAISVAIDNDDVDWIKSFGKALHLLPVDTIIQYLDAGDRSALGVMEEGVLSMGADAPCAYLQLYIDLAQHLNSDDYLRVVQPLLEGGIFGFLIADAYTYGSAFLEIFDQCCTVWALIRTKCLISGRRIQPLRELVWPALEFGQLGTVLRNQSGAFCAAYARLLVVMDLLDSQKLFDLMTDGWDWELSDKDLADPLVLDCNQALFSLIEHEGTGAKVLDSIAEGFNRRKQFRQDE